MGKRSRKQNEVEPSDISAGNNKTHISSTHPENITVTKEICSNPKRKKKMKNNVFIDTTSNKDNVIKNKNSKKQDSSTSDLELNVETNREANHNNYKRKEQNVVHDGTNGNRLSEETSISSDKKSRKKTKQNKATELVVSTHETKKKQKDQKVIHEKVYKEVNNDKKESLCISNKKTKKKKQSIEHEEVQFSNQTVINDSNGNPKKKKNRKVVEEEVPDDEEIDRYCDELDEVHNKQYENWVKLIEANFNKNAK